MCRGGSRTALYRRSDPVAHRLRIQIIRRAIRESPLQRPCDAALRPVHIRNPAGSTDTSPRPNTLFRWGVAGSDPTLAPNAPGTRSRSHSPARTVRTLVVVFIWMALRIVRARAVEGRVAVKVAIAVEGRVALVLPAPELAGAATLIGATAVITGEAVEPLGAASGAAAEDGWPAWLGHLCCDSPCYLVNLFIGHVVRHKKSSFAFRAVREPPLQGQTRGSAPTICITLNSGLLICAVSPRRISAHPRPTLQVHG